MVGSEIDGRVINLDYSKPRPEGDGSARRDRAKAYGDERSPPSDTLFVGNIAFGADQDMLSEAFGAHGTVTGVRLPTDPDTGALKGFGYVSFASVEDATAAIEAMNGADIGGRPVRLDYGRARAPDGDRRGGFGRGRGGFGDRGGRGGRGGFGDRGRGRGRGGFGDRGGSRGGRGGSTNRGGFGDFKGQKMKF